MFEVVTRSHDQWKDTCPFNRFEFRWCFFIRSETFRILVFSSSSKDCMVQFSFKMSKSHWPLPETTLNSIYLSQKTQKRAVKTSSYWENNSCVTIYGWDWPHIIIKYLQVQIPIATPHILFDTPEIYLNSLPVVLY